jgi:quercetin dioxygenase-like cupin family protein
MKRSSFLKTGLLALPSFAALKTIATKTKNAPITTEPFIVQTNKNRYGSETKFLGVHLNNVIVSGKDTDGQLSMFEYKGYDTIGPGLHIHLKQDEIFTVKDGRYRFVVGNNTHELTKGQTIFLPRNIPHTWIQLSKYGSLLYALQPAGKMEEFFIAMNALKEKPTLQQLEQLHQQHDMKVVGPPLSL